MPRFVICGAVGLVCRPLGFVLSVQLFLLIIQIDLSTTNVGLRYVVGEGVEEIPFGDDQGGFLADLARADLFINAKKLSRDEGDSSKRQLLIQSISDCITCLEV